MYELRQRWCHRVCHAPRDCVFFERFAVEHAHSDALAAIASNHLIEREVQDGGRVVQKKRAPQSSW